MCLLKHYNNRGFNIFGAPAVQRKVKTPKMITGISGFVFFLWPFRDGYLFFQKSVAETPILMLFVGCGFFWAKLSNEGILDPQKQTMLNDN